MPSRLSRRGFLAGSASLVAVIAALHARRAGARTAASSQAVQGPYGPLHPATDLETGLPLILLPEGFQYRTYSWAGDPMTNGEPTPDLHDGMGVIATRGRGEELEVTLVRNHERAQRLNNSPFMKEIKAKIDKAGVVVLADAWLAGAVASKKDCVRNPDDIKGVKIRSAGPTFAAMWQKAGGSIVSIPSNEVYNALQTGVAEATDTSAGSFVSFRLYEQVKCLTAPGENALWFMYEPVLMSKRNFSKLNKAQQDALLAAGKKAEAYFNEATKTLDDKMVDVFKKNNVEVITLTPAEFEAWVNVARQSSYAEFAKEVPDGKALIDQALAAE